MINSFHGEYNFLSNFYPVKILYKGNYYPSIEHAYQASKTENESIRCLFRVNISAGQAKKLGKEIVLRKDWDFIKLSIMEELVRYKFYNNKDLQEKLIATGNEELIEGNNWNDYYWGVCQGVGENHLGKILMKIRKEIRSIYV